jgi:hypothetical protein
MPVSVICFPLRANGEDCWLIQRGIGASRQPESSNPESQGSGASESVICPAAADDRAAEWFATPGYEADIAGGSAPRLTLRVPGG